MTKGFAFVGLAFWVNAGAVDGVDGGLEEVGQFRLARWVPCTEELKSRSSRPSRVPETTGSSLTTTCAVSSDDNGAQ